MGARRRAIFWNVQRLFDPTGLPVARTLGAVGKRWTPQDYQRKIENVAAGLRAAAGVSPPAVVALAEVESARVQRDLLDAAGWGGLMVIDEVSPDDSIKGLDVGLALDPSVFSRTSVRARSVALDNSFDTRDLYDVRVRLLESDEEVVFLVAHWPSRLISEGATLRFAYSIYLQRLLSSVLKYSKSDIVRPDGSVELPIAERLQHRWNTPCVVLGDFNDEPFDPSVRAAMQSSRYVDLVERRGRLSGKSLSEPENYLAKTFTLLNPCWDLHFGDDESRGGTYYRSEWRSYDQVLFTHGAIRPDANMRYIPGSTHVARTDAVQVPGGREARMATRRVRTPHPFAVDSPDGMSDHFPLVFELEFQ